MTTNFSNNSIEEAEAALKSSQRYQASKGEQTLNKIGDKVLAGTNSEWITVTQSTIATLDFSLVKDHVSNFIESSKILVNALDEVGKVHPFIQAAVVIFKAGIQLELTRRENDERVLALNMTMCDMMSVLKLLKRVSNPKDRVLDGLTIEERLQSRMGGIIESIKSCAKLCDSYQRRHAAIKFFTSIRWQAKFAGVAEQFVRHQNSIQSDLQMYVSIEITNTNLMLSTLNKNVNEMMGMVFDRMRSPEERELANFVKSKGGVVAAPDDKLLKEILKNQQQRQEKEEEDPIKGSQKPDFPVNITKYKEELNKEVDTIVEENSVLFERAFGAIEISIREVKGTIVREGDRVIETILAGVNNGPHERIVDRDIYHIWKEMGWKGSVKATHLVMAVHDHFSAKSNAALSEIHTIASEADPSSATEDLKDIMSITQQAIPFTPTEDLWSLQYITVHRAQPLMEALDDDGSSFITVNEVNEFTASRPEGWSLPRWIAYWTIGFEITTQWYYRRIRRLFSFLSDSSKGVLPANRKVVSEFMRCWSICATENFLSGLRAPEYWDGLDWDDNSLFLKFKGWVMSNEKRMDEILRRLVYYIDQDNTLNTVTGGGRPEKYVMPVLYLLMKRSHWVMKRAHEVVLHPNELNILHCSMASVHYAVRDRVQKLQAIYKLQNAKPEKKLKNVFFGLYAYTFAETEMGDFWTGTLNQYDMVHDGLLNDPEIPETELYYGPQTEELDLDPSSTDLSSPNVLTREDDHEEPNNEPGAAHSLVGAWSGTYSYDSRRSADGPVSFFITQHTPDDRFHCSGLDTWGPFTVNGRIKGGRITFLKEYAELQGGQKVSWRYNGSVSEERDEISGYWGQPSHDDNEDRFLVDGDAGQGLTILGEGDGGGKEDGDEEDGDEEDGDEENEEEENTIIEDGDENADEESLDNGTNTDAAPAISIEPPTPREEIDELDMTGEDGASEEGSALTSVVTGTIEIWMPSGSFVLFRRPVDHALYCPSTEEFQENKQRALWKLVRNVSKYWFRTHHLTWEGIRERRDKRKMYLELWDKRSEFEGTFSDPTDEAEWLALVPTVHPSDLHLWQTIAQFRRRREIIHTDVSCDHCDKYNLPSTRIVCITCSEGEVNHTIDLCPDCQTESVHRKKDNKNHKPFHPMIQFRRTLLLIERIQLMSRSDSRLKALSSEGSKSCTSCEKELLEKPYWYCTECEVDTFMCVECNNLSEREKPWLLQRKATPEYLHDWAHTMVLNTKVVEEKNKSELFTDQRLAKLEAKLDAKLDKQADGNRNFEASVNARLQRLEELLERMIITVAQAT